MNGYTVFELVRIHWHVLSFLFVCYLAIASFAWADLIKGWINVLDDTERNDDNLFGKNIKSAVRTCKRVFGKYKDS